MPHELSVPENTSTAITNPVDNLRLATDVAHLCREIVEQTAINIQGKKYPPVEAWMSIATAHGFIASCDEPKRVEGGVQARAYLRRMSDGQVMSEAWGFVGDDEPTWEKRKEFAKRAMAQTRGVSRVCRAAFGYVVVMMKIKGMSTTPAEEMFGDPQPAPTNQSEPPPPQDEVMETHQGGVLNDVSPQLTESGIFEVCFALLGGKKIWTRDAELASSLKTHENTRIMAHLRRGKKPNVFQLLSFVLE